MSIAERLVALTNTIRILAVCALSGACAYHDAGLSDPCERSPVSFEIIERQNVTHCSVANGAIVVASMSAVPLQFSLDKERFSLQTQFIGLSPGTYSVYAKSPSGCMDSLHFEIMNAVSDLSLTITETTADSDCLDNNGMITVSVEGGSEPYRMELDGNEIPFSLQLSGIEAGPHQLTITDENNCTTQNSFTIPRLPTGVSWLRDIKPIIDRSCAKDGCHGFNSARARLTTYEEVKDNAANIKARTRNGSMPFDGPLPEEQVVLIGCWVDDGALNN